jgi:hypothetical protein
MLRAICVDLAAPHHFPQVADIRHETSILLVEAVKTRPKISRFGLPSGTL